jgi:hypothetical protein
MHQKHPPANVAVFRFGGVKADDLFRSLSVFAKTKAGTRITPKASSMMGSKVFIQISRTLRIVG